MFNRWRAPGRYGRTTADPTSLSDSNGPGSGSRQQRSFSDAHQLNALHAATNKYPPFVEGGKASDAVPVVLNGGYNKEFESGKENPW